MNATDVKPDTGSEPTDVAPKGGLDFPNPSGRKWSREKNEDAKPKTPSPAKPRTESAAARKRKVEARVGKLYTGFAQFAGAMGADYPSQVLLANSTDFVDAVMEIAEDDPRILDWFDSRLAVSGYWKLALVGVSVSLPIAAYYGAAPEFIIPLLGAPPIPDEPIATDACPQCGHPLGLFHGSEGCIVDDCPCGMKAEV